MVASSHEARTAAGLVRLATGSPGPDWGSLSWRDVAALGVRERCIALAWLRSSEILTRHADPDVARWWRELALRMLARGHAHVQTLSAVTTLLARAGVRCVILKGAPLSAMLYREPGARASADLDVWIPLNDRRQAREILLQNGWLHADGVLPDDEAFRLPGAHGEYYLEVRSRLLHSRFDYLALPVPELTAVQVAGSVLPVMTGSLLPSYLAIQIAKHRFAPLLWLIDHRTLWERLDDAGRTLARWTAVRCGLQRYLEWAVRRGEILDKLVDGDPSAVRRLGLQDEWRDIHPMWRHVQLAPSPSSGVRAMWAWLAPPWITSARPGPRGFMRRVGRHWRAAIETRPRRPGPKGAALSVRDVTVAADQMVRVVREVSLIGGRLWINTTGSSMHPTLLEGDRVLLEPTTRVAHGDIVLVDTGGSPLLHRIVRMHGELITTRGDARMTSDATLPRRDVIARAVRARRGDVEWSLEPSNWERLRLRATSGRKSKTDAGEARAHA